MTAIALIASLVVGAALALQFRVFVLIPLTFVWAVGTVAIGISLSAGAWVTTFAAVSAVVGLEVGYLAMSAIRFIVAAPTPQLISNRLTLSDPAR